jgi:hypothetical protein
VQPLEIVEYFPQEAPTPAVRGDRMDAIEAAFELEVELINATGRGSRGWTAEEIARIKNGASLKDLGYTGHHINRVKQLPDWQGDPRNIEFLRQGSGEEHMVLGHPGGTRAQQPPRELIDREAMLRKAGK